MMRSFENHVPGTGTEQPIYGKCATMQGEGGHRIRQVRFHPGSRPRRSLSLSANPCTSCRLFLAGHETFPTSCTPGGTLPDIGGTSLSAEHQARTAFL